MLKITVPESETDARVRVSTKDRQIRAYQHPYILKRPLHLPLVMHVLFVTDKISHHKSGIKTKNVSTEVSPVAK